jgi:hypothetical protein
MEFYQYKVMVMKWVREKALEDPTYKFGSLRLATTVEDLDDRGQLRTTVKEYERLCRYLRELEKQGVLIKVGEATEAIRGAGYSQDYFVFKDVNHPVILRLLGLSDPQQEKNEREIDLLKRQTMATELQAAEAAKQSHLALQSLEQGEREAYRTRIMAWIGIGISAAAVLLSLFHSK